MILVSNIFVNFVYFFYPYTKITDKMEEGLKIIEINSTYVDEHLREFFDVSQTPVNIDNICLFSAKTIEEYNSHSETKLMGKQKLEASCELAKSIIDKVMVFVPEDQRRKISKNIYHNIDTIENTIQFIVDISNNPNIINAGKWLRADTIIKKTSRGCFSRMFSCSGEKKKTTEVIPEAENSEEVNKTKDEIKETKTEKREREKNEKIMKEKEKKDEKERIKREKGEEKERIKREKKNEEERIKSEKKEREKKIKELLEETERKVKELKSKDTSKDTSGEIPEDNSGVLPPDDKEKNVDIEI